MDHLLKSLCLLASFTRKFLEKHAEAFCFCQIAQGYQEHTHQDDESEYHPPTLVVN
jgi:hypothetical protein